MKKLTLLFLLVHIGFIVSAATIKGKITNSRTGSGIPDATVMLDSTGYGAVTDLDGNYEIFGVKPGQYTIKVFAIGFQGSSSKLHVNQEETTYNVSLIEDTKDIKTIKVVGKLDKNSDQSARKSEKDADNIINVVSAQTIEKSPDITVANALQRVSGVSLQRTSQGDGKYAIIRGMDPRYNNTLINGVKIPSPNSKDRYVPLDVIPSDLVQRMEVTKALTPSMEGDAIGGTVNVVMKDAPDSLYFTANLSGGYNQLFMQNNFRSYTKQSVQTDPYKAHGSNPNLPLQVSDFSKNIFNYKNSHPAPNVLGGFALGKRFFKNKLGVLLAGSYQNLYRGATSKYYFTRIDVHNVPHYLHFYNRLYSTHQVRKGINLKLDYRINSRHKISLYNLYLNMLDYEQRNTYDSTIYITSTANSNYIYQRSRTQVQSIYASNLQGSDSLAKNLNMDWSLLYSVATGAYPDWAEYQLDLSYNIANAPKTVDNVKYIWQKNVDRDISAAVNLTYTPVIFKKKIEFKVGGLDREKHRSNYYNNYQLNPNTQVTGNGSAAIYTGNLNTYPLDIYNPYGTGTYGQNNYTAIENVTAFYGQAKIIFGRLTVLGGLRTEITHQHFAMKSPYPGAPTGEDISYVDPMLSVNTKYTLTEKTNLRASFFQGISRPNFYELVPYRIQGEFYTKTGNPYLQHATSNNFDVKYEWFPNLEDVLSVGAFYKQINNPIELFYNVYGTGALNKTAAQLADVRAVPAEQYQLMPFNFGTATNYGLEINLIKYIKNFGISANYTYTNSQITSVKIYNDFQKKATVSRLQTRPLQGQSKHLGNVSLFYRNKKKRINLQLALVYTGKRLVQVSPYYGLDYYQKPLTIVDFSGDVALAKKWVLFWKVHNLANSPYRVELSNGLLVQKDYYSRNFQIGLRFTY